MTSTIARRGFLLSTLALPAAARAVKVPAATQPKYSHRQLLDSTGRGPHNFPILVDGKIKYIHPFDT